MADDTDKTSVKAGMAGFFRYLPSSKFDWRRFLLVSVFALVCCLFCQNGLVELLGGIHPNADSNVFFTVARMMFEKSAAPYRDAFDHKGPLIYFIDCAALYMGGFYMIFFMEFAAVWLSLLFFWLSIRKFASPCVRVSALFFFAYLIAYCMAGGNLTEEFALPPVCFAFYALMMFFEKNHIMLRHAFWGGFSIVWILFLKFNCAAVHFVLAGLAVLWYLRKKRFTECFKFIFCLLTGGVVLALPVLAYLYGRQVLSYCWNDYIVFNLEYAGTQNLLSTLLRICERSFKTPPFLIVFPVMGIYFAFWKQITKKRRLLISVLFLIFLANAIVILPGNFCFEHYLFPAIPLTAMFLVLGEVLVEEQFVRISTLPETAFPPAVASVMSSADKICTLGIAKINTITAPVLRLFGQPLPIIPGFTPSMAPVLRFFCQIVLLVATGLLLLHSAIVHSRILKRVLSCSKFEPDPIVLKSVHANAHGLLVYTGGAETGYWYRRYNAFPTVRYFYRPPVEFKGERKREFLSGFTPEKSPLIFVPATACVQADVLSLLNAHYSPIATRDGILFVSKAGKH